MFSVDSYDSNAAALCLTTDSPVTKADGTIVQVGDLAEGDVLKGYAFDSLDDHSDATFLDWYTSSLVDTPKDVTVKNITFSFSNKIYNINEGQIKGTSEHPMLISSSVHSDFRFGELMALTTDDKLIKEESGSLVQVPITSIEIETSDVEIVSIDVEEQDTYLVNGYVTHNKGGNSHTDLSNPGAPTSLAFNSGTGTFSWVAPTFGGTITAYDWQFDNNSDFSSPLTNLNVTEWSKTNVNTNELTSLHGSIIASGTYYFRVRARGAGLVGTYTSGLEITL